jgi:hypothetical protein
MRLGAAVTARDHHDNVGPISADALVCRIVAPVHASAVKRRRSPTEPGLLQVEMIDE